MELFEHPVQTQPSLTLPWNETLLMPIGDVQFGSAACDFDKFRRHIDWGMKHGAYFIGMGDYVDVASPSGRQKIRHADFYDSVTDALEEVAMVHLNKFYDAVKGTEGRWLGLLHGHHYFQFEHGGTTDTMLAERLKTRFLGTCSIVQLKFPRTDRNHIVCQIWAHHGVGSGMTIASPINKLERMMSRFPSVDIFLMGHYSRKVGYPIDALVPVFGRHPRLRAKRRILACTGGFARGYLVGGQRGGHAHGDYVEEAMMPPTNLGGVLIYIRPVHTNLEDRLDLSISQ